MCRVVIVEDELLLTVTLRTQLEAGGIIVVGTTLNGRAAVELCRQTRPDAVLMDLRMSVMDGLEATRRIMAECPTRVVVFSAMTDEQTRAKAMAAGAARFLVKPDDAEEIVAALRECPPNAAPTGDPARGGVG